jgi:hypothetical protein
MPRPPKKVPQWLFDFMDYVRAKSKSKTEKDALTTFDGLIESRYGKFVTQVESDLGPPKKRNKPDPVKCLENAAQKAWKHLEKDKDPEKLGLLKEKLIKGLPSVFVDSDKMQTMKELKELARTHLDKLDDPNKFPEAVTLFLELSKMCPEPVPDPEEADMSA